MSDWEERRRRSFGYYLCLIVMLFPLFAVSAFSLFALILLNFSALIPFLLSTAAIIGLTFGLGAKYHYRGINPSSRNMMNATDGHYFERIGADESDYP